MKETSDKTGKRRGALSNREGRYERFHLEPPDEQLPECGEDGPDAGPSPRTRVTPERTGTIIARNDSPDVPFDRSINPYRGCEHGCVYCFARPSHAWLGMSPGLDFETRIVSKPDAARLLSRELSRPSYRCAPIALGSNTDPYQPAERASRITRQVLEVLAVHDHPVTIVTKSTLVLRDADLLGPMAARRLAQVILSITTLDGALAGRLEPRAASPRRRVETLSALRARGIPVGVLVSPVIPGINDAEIERILEACAGAGAEWADYVLLRLPLEIKDLFEEWLCEHEPLKAPRVLGLLREMRGGGLNDAAFGRRMRGTGPHAELLRRRFEIACRRHSLKRVPEPLETGLFHLPVVPGSPGAQGRLF